MDKATDVANDFKTIARTDGSGNNIPTLPCTKDGNAVTSKTGHYCKTDADGNIASYCYKAINYDLTPTAWDKHYERGDGNFKIFRGI